MAADSHILLSFRALCSTGILGSIDGTSLYLRTFDAWFVLCYTLRTFNER